ncbi:SDR family oxidoreductase [Microbacterium rhizophilus]|uniref:SDR family oxidoreductase n=1 Tax=Microbacterium rhizophilus TaxID=3138934 RepID=UPI0031E5B761
MTDIAGRVAVITGGASGIGRGIAEQLIEEGAKVVIADINAEALRRTADEIGAYGVVTDVTDIASVAALAAAAIDRFGRIDIAVNNAGVGPTALIEDLTLADWRWMIDVNLWGVIHGVHTFLPYLIANEHGGHIVNTASMAIFNPLPGLGAYSAAKFGVQGLSETLALELAEHHPNVHVTILPPGPVRTNIKESLKARPASEAGALRDVDLTADESAADLRWVDPGTAGRIVARAIRNDDLYAPTHPEWWPIVDARNERIHADFEKYPPLD